MEFESACLGQGLDEERRERIVQLGDAAENFGTSLAKVVDLTTSSVDEIKMNCATKSSADLLAGRRRGD